ncbi:Tocopherol O-methyltransferase [Hibiscus syriacus]|uniref:Tocopherol O-methyltransferase n=1 Tax=Hibiscus syriacus TaxID=106335 RepID=A0A6A3A840_HIBSY|nr:tocopherol O-methyltransferase, chloroplastic-like [Hibiscus syriacus]KAE8699272.1 Tocopherol O-methyltransferase [Hibiscus syriacus]
MALQYGIAEFYDQSSGLWEVIWGHHMHHGFYDPSSNVSASDHRAAQIRMIEESLRFAGITGSYFLSISDLSEESLQPWEKKLLNRICNAYYLPEWCSTSDYVKLLQSLSLLDVKAADWSEHVVPFWPVVIRSAFTWKGFVSLLRSGLNTIKGALVMPLMIQAYQKSVIKFAIITCRKPE